MMGLAMVAFLQGVALDSVTVCVHDAQTLAPLVGASVRWPATGAVRVFSGACGRWAVSGESITIQVARVGYAPSNTELTGRAPLVLVSLVPHGRRASGDTLGLTQLPTQRVVAPANASAPVGRGIATVRSEDARARGVSTMNGLLTLLPYTTLRSARGESGISLRGARREQVVITLDGLPLNDPATGVADIGDLPLVSVQAATVMPGADPLGAGVGATGGVMALTTASVRQLHLRTGAFGQYAAEGAWSGIARTVRWNAALAHRLSRNDFAFENTAGAAPSVETRVNNDERRTVLSAGMVAPRWQWSLLGSTGERGMVGAANVRTYDADRSRTERIVSRTQVAVGRSMVTSGVRWFHLAYRDPTRPALDTRSRAWAADLDWRASSRLGDWRMGVGADGLSGTGGLTQQRQRGFVAWQQYGHFLPVRTPRGSGDDTRALRVDIGMRADAIEQAGVQPTASVGATWRAMSTPQHGTWSVVSRVAQAVRVPTLYDLYFSSPQRLFVRALNPERITLDANAGVQHEWQRPTWRVSSEFMLVSRDTREAIVWFPGNFGWSPANVGRERLRGIEARTALASVAWSVSAWSTWYNSTLRSGGLTIPTPYVPQLSVGANSAWRVRRTTTHGTTLSTNWRLQGRRPFTAGPRNAAFELPTVNVVDIAVAQQFVLGRTDTVCSVAFDNIADVQWQSVRGFPMPGRGWSVAFTVQPRP